MAKLPVYDITMETAPGDENRVGWSATAFTPDPAVVVKGVAYKSQFEKLSFADDLKYRITAPAMIPMSIYRKDEEDEGDGKGYEYETRFTPEVIDQLHAQFMADLQGKGEVGITDAFNYNHDDKKKVPAYVLETWIVDNPETDKAFTTYGIKVPKGTLMMTAQVTDKAYYNELVKSGATGFSIEGYLGMKEIKMNANPKEYGDCLIFNQAGEILLLQRTEGDELEPNKWCFPGGKIEEGELPQQGAIREAMEETGLSPETEGDSVQHVDSVVNEDGSRTHYYRFRTQLHEDVSLSSEHVAFAWVNLESMGEKEIIFNNADRFKSLFNKANNKTEYTMKEGEKFQIGEDWYIVQNGKPVPCDADGKPLEMEDEPKDPKDPPADPPADPKDVENAEDEPKDPPADPPADPADPPTGDPELEAKVKAIVEPMLDEVLKVLADVKSMIPAPADPENPDQEEAMKSDKKQSYAKTLNFLNQK